MGQWIWKFGDFEIYHSLLLHNRRRQYGYFEPPVWKLYTPEPVVRFRKQVTTDGGIFYVHACGNSAITVGTAYPDIKKYGGATEITLAPGTTEITIVVSNKDTFPCLYVDGVVESDESWLVDDFSGDFRLVGTSEQFCDAQHTPEVFPFSYEKIEYIKKEKVDGGILFDFGKETFAGTVITGLTEKKTQINFGESREEALDDTFSVIHFMEEPKEGKLSYEPFAFRYVYVGGQENAKIAAEYEYLSLEQKGDFSCGEELINEVYRVAAYTFQLNCREFFLDGIKRDRWVWSADAYQSLFVNRYLYLDPQIEKRTLIALGGKSPFVMHINGIMDYSFFWVMSLYEYYVTYGDVNFLKQIYGQMKEVMDFCKSRADEDGFIRGREGDWIFIDWAPMDKMGALCGEQILYAKALECYAKICGIIGAPIEGADTTAQALCAQIFEKFYDAAQGVFIDSYESGKKNVTRHSNILAYLFLPCSTEQKKNIYEKVLLNGKIRQITTPYFKFYENQVHCMEGNEKLLEQSLRSYYGGMLKMGATTLYEEYDPAMQGREHYAMYGNPYEKSLCHAWSASPIYLLGAYRLGVKNTGIAYDHFEVAPNPGDLGTFSGRVPLLGGYVQVAVEETCIRAKATVPGGTFLYGDCRRVMEPGEEIVVFR